MSGLTNSGDRKNNWAEREFSTAYPSSSARLPAAGDGNVRERLLFDNDWRFALGNECDAQMDFSYGTGQGFAKAGDAAGPFSPKFDDRDWRKLNLPHDWVVELPFEKSTESSLDSHGYKPIGVNYPQNSIGWYRKSFEIPASDEGKRIAMVFDGVFRDSQVWVNGHLLARNLSGYIGFRCVLTDYLNYGGKNVVVVRVDATQVEGWFYEGAGIYRHVWLVKTAPLNIAPNGTVITTEVNGPDAVVTVKTRVENESDQPARFQLTDEITGAGKAGPDAAQEIGPWQSREVVHRIPIKTAHLWSTEDPNLYRLDSTLTVGNAPVDSVSTTFGVRTIRFDKDNGFYLNGKRVEIKGVCDHQDHAGVGSAVPDRLNAWRLEQLKIYGINALRTSHNPPTPSVLDACDRLGILVMDENRLIGSSSETLSQLTRLIERDRNHPSVIMWSIGNEEWVEQTNMRARRIAASMKRTIKELDPTRPVTYASNAGNSDTGINSVVDLRGFNYKNVSNIDKYHSDHPDQILYGSEEASTVSTRGIYANDKQKGYVSAYDLNRPGWGALAEDWWTFYDARPFLAGAFVWTGFDYRGEPTPYKWPCINSHFGILDTCGFPKDIAFYYQAWWTDKPVLHILPHWNWAGKEGQPINVWCFSNLEKIELFLNGKSMGSQTMRKDGHLEWQVPYEPGTLEARGYKGGNLVMTTQVETTGAPAKLVLQPDRTTIDADGRDVSIIAVSAVDAQGRVVPIASNLVHFTLEGAGKILGVGNGDPSCHEPDKYFDIGLAAADWRRSLFNGYAQIIVQSGRAAGRLVLHAQSTGLSPTESDLHTK